MASSADGHSVSEPTGPGAADSRATAGASAAGVGQPTDQTGLRLRGNDQPQDSSGMTAAESARTGHNRARTGAFGTALRLLRYVSRQREVAECYRESESRAVESDMRKGLETAIDASIDKGVQRGLSTAAAFRCVQQEASKTLESIEQIETADARARAHNRRMHKREAVLSLAGLLCLSFPVLLLFHMLVQLLPRNYRIVLAHGAQEPSAFGMASRYVYGNSKRVDDVELNDYCAVLADSVALWSLNLLDLATQTGSVSMPLTCQMPLKSITRGARACSWFFVSLCWHLSWF